MRDKPIAVFHKTAWFTPGAVFHFEIPLPLPALDNDDVVMIIKERLGEDIAVFDSSTASEVRYNKTLEGLTVNAEISPQDTRRLAAYSQIIWVLCARNAGGLRPIIMGDLKQDNIILSDNSHDKMPVPSALSAATVQDIVDKRLADIRPNPTQNPLLTVTTTLDF